MRAHPCMAYCQRPFSIAIIAMSWLLFVARAPTAKAVTQAFYDGSGSPAAAGFTLTGAAAIWTFDSDNGVAGSAPGFLHQRFHPSNVNTDAHWDILSLSSNDLDHSEGWFIEQRFKVIADERSIDDGFGIGNELRSSNGLYWTRMSTTGITIGFNGGEIPYPTAGPFHTLRYQVSPGAVNPQVILDGISLGTVPMMPATAERTFEFGDMSITGDGEVVWDYIAINQELPASRPIDFGRQWVRQHPLTLMGASTGSLPDFDISDYRGLNLNTVFANNNPPVADAAVAAAMPWHYHHNSSPRPYAPYSASDKATINQLIAKGGVTAWMLQDEPVTSDEIAAVGQSAQWMRDNHPELMLYATVGRGDGLSNAFLQEVITVIKPDALMFDWYPFRDDGTTDTNRWFADVTAMRRNALQAGIPYWGWLQSLTYEFRRTPSESDTRYNGYTLLTAGYSGLGYFTYDTNSKLFDANGNPTAFYNAAAAANLEYARLGQSLRFLTSADLRFVAGKHTVFGSFTQANSTPPALSNWVSGAGGDPHLQTVAVDFAQPNSIGSEKNGLIGLFTDDSGQRYFMLTNLNHAANLTASGAALSFVVTFDVTVDTLLRLNRLTGEPEKLTLTNHTLNLTLPGGTGDLFKYDTGDFAGIPGGDADLDGDVDLSDLGILATNYGTTSNSRWSKGDFDLDGDVDLADLGRLASNYGAGSSQAFADYRSLTSVPEPAMFVPAIASAIIIARPKIIRQPVGHLAEASANIDSESF